jgi:LuxR family maltose regulon positive regulatory protein
VAAGELTWAARLIEQYFDELYYLGGEGTTLRRWLSALPDDLVRSRPRLLLAQAQLASVGRVEEMEPLLDAAERAAPGAAGEPFEPTAGRAGSMLVNVPPMAALLGRLIAAQRAGPGFPAAAGVPLGYLARLRGAFGAGPAAPHAAGVPGLVDPLTGRELEVLQMLAAGKSNQAIAGQLVVTLDTVKKHVSHVLGKLGAANRTEAVTRARELGLTP